jgi:hypothetical protein
MVAAGLAGCGSTTYFAGRSLPPSGLTNRVLIAIQSPSVFTKGALQIVDAYYDTRSGYTGQPAAFSLSGYGGALPISIQSMPEEERAAVYGSGDGSLTVADYATEKTTGTVSNLNGLSSSIFMTRNGTYVFAANQSTHVLTVVNQSNSSAYPLSLPGVYRVSVNPGGTMAIAFAQNSNYAYYLRQLTAAQSLSYSGGSSTWPKAAVDCEPQNAPGWCLLQAQSPDAVDSTGNYYGAPLVFDRPVKAVFSADGSTAYVLNCGPECGGTKASISLLPVAPMIFPLGQASGLLPCNSAPCTNTGYLTRVNLSTNAVIASTGSSPNPVSISDGMPGAVSRMIQADDNTLWIGMTKCNDGERFYNNQAYGCLTMFNTSTNTVTLLEPYIGDATGIAAVTGLHKIYTAQGGQVYINSTKDGTSIDNQFVTVTGTAYDVAYMDAVTDANNTVY